MKNEHLPWPGLMEIAFGMQGLTPAMFWEMTPPEWLASYRGWKRMRGIADTPGLSRQELETAMRRFPD